MDIAQTVARALSVLELLGKHKKLTAPRMIEILGYHRSTTYRLLNTLQQLNYIRRDNDNGLYSLTPRILRISSSIIEHQEITIAAKPHLKELFNQTHETIHLAFLENHELVYLDKMESDKNLRVVMSSQKGHFAPLYCTGIGKALLAWVEEFSIDDYLKQTELQRFTENTITDADSLKKEMEEIRMRGYAFDKEEHEKGVFCIAAPVKDIYDRVVAAISVSIPSARYDKSTQNELTTKVLNTAGRISDSLRG